MNRKIAASSLLLAAAFAGNAFAESPLQGNDAFTSAKDRAAVQAELADFRKGANPWSISYNPLRGFQGSASRATVQADYIAARGQVSAFTGEDSGSQALAQARGAFSHATLAGQTQNAQ